MISNPEPTIWSRDTGQRIPCFDRCHLTITWMSNIKEVCCKPAGVYGHRVGHRHSKLEPEIWSCDTGHIGINGEVDRRTDGH